MGSLVIAIFLNFNLNGVKMRFKFKDEYIVKLKKILESKNYKYFVNTMGCQLNQNDSEKYMGMLQEIGIIPTNNIDEANIILFNTCCVRENAENTLFGRLGTLKQRRLKDKNLYIVVVGCMSQQKHILDKIKKSYGYVDIVLGTNSMHAFPKLLYQAIVNKQKVYDFVDIDGDVVEDIPVTYQDKYKAQVSIIYGCNNFCTYCIVPFVRGRERSRKVEDILKDIQDLGKKGYKEILLLGQNVNSYGKDFEDKNINFSYLLNQIEKTEGIEIIRFVSPHPKDFTDQLIDTIANSKKIAKQVHLPLQSGSDRILKAMNRKYTKQKYLELVEKIKSKIPDVSFSTDIIVGFPGETEQDFEDTLDVVKKVRFDQIFMFIYSKREGTIAAKLKDDTPAQVKVQRLETLKKLYEQILNQNNQKLIGKVFKILVEGKSKNNPKYYTGRMYSNKAVIFKAEESLVGTIQKVQIESNHLWYLQGKIAE